MSKSRAPLLTSITALTWTEDDVSERHSYVPRSVREDKIKQDSLDKQEHGPDHLSAFTPPLRRVTGVPSARARLILSSPRYVTVRPLSHNTHCSLLLKKTNKKTHTHTHTLTVLSVRSDVIVSNPREPLTLTRGNNDADWIPVHARFTGPSPVFMFKL